MSLRTQKRTIYQAQINNSMSIGNDQTLVPVLVNRISQGETKKGNNPGTPYYRLNVICMMKEPTFIKMREKRKKQKGGDEEVTEEVVDPDAPKGTTICGGDEMLVTTYDVAAATLEGGLMVKLAMTTDWYQERFTFQAGKVLVDSKGSEILCDKVYNDLIVDTAISEIPTTGNVTREQFREGMEEKHMNRTFVLPLSVENTKFANVEIQIGDDEVGRFFTKKKKDPNQYVGVNTLLGDTTVNMFKTVYTPKEEGLPKIMMSLAYMPEIWDCFGCANVDLWAKVAPRFIFNAVGWYVYGYSNILRLEAIVGDSDDDSFDYSTGFVTRMNVDLKATVSDIGISLSHGYIEDHYGADSEYENDHEYERHPLNSGYKVSLKRKKPCIVNFTDLSADQTESFIKEMKKNGAPVKFYGIFAEDKAYELPDNDPAAREDAIIEAGLVPDMVFAVI